MPGRPILAALVSCAAVLVTAPAAMAAPASISPSHVTAGQTVKLVVDAPACSASSLELSGDLFAGNLFLSHHGEPAHTFAGEALVSTSAEPGSHQISLRCDGGNYGSVKIQVTASTGKGTPGPGGSKSEPTPAGTLIARIGGYYTDDLFPYSHSKAVTIHWGACAKAGGTVIYFPKHKHLYPFEDPRAEKLGFPAARLSGPPLDPTDPFKTHMYVGDLAPEHTGTITLRCMRLEHGGHSGPLVSIFAGQLKIKYVHEDANFDPNTLGALPEFDLNLGDNTMHFDDNFACAEVGTKTLSLTSDAFAADANGSHTIVFTRTAESMHTLKAPEFEANVQTADVATGNYPAVVMCGTGRVGVGKILVSS
jgi:hypothetical protein